MNNCMRVGLRALLPAVALTMTMAGCASVQRVPSAYKNLPPPNSLLAPRPILGNTGKFMCPYTQDEVLADWVDKAINARLGAALGSLLGAVAAAQQLEEDAEGEDGDEYDDVNPSERIAEGAREGEELGRQLAIALSGGWAYIRRTSDLSFNSIEVMAVYLYVEHSSHDHYYAALDATFQIYPELRGIYVDAILKARRR